MLGYFDRGQLLGQLSQKSIQFNSNSSWAPVECSQKVHWLRRLHHTVSVWEDRNSIVGRENSMCKGGVATHSASGECVQLLCGGSICSEQGLKSCLEVAQSCLCDSVANMERLVSFKAGLCHDNTIIDVAGIDERVGSEWSHLQRSEEPWARSASVQGSWRLIHFGLLWTSVALLLTWGSFLPQNRTFVNVWR